MTDKTPRVFYMGEEQPFDELPEADATKFEDYFAPVKLSGRAIDQASKMVPEEYWKPYGIYTWLQGRADAAFQRMPTSDKEITVGRLRYKFEYTAEGPVLATVVLV